MLTRSMYEMKYIRHMTARMMWRVFTRRLCVFMLSPVSLSCDGYGVVDGCCAGDVQLVRSVRRMGPLSHSPTFLRACRRCRRRPTAAASGRHKLQALHLARRPARQFRNEVERLRCLVAAEFSQAMRMQVGCVERALSLRDARHHECNDLLTVHRIR